MHAVKSANGDHCPKCGQYSTHSFLYLNPEATVFGFKGECIVRQCPVCSYRYTQPCADRKASSE